MKHRQGLYLMLILLLTALLIGCTAAPQATATPAETTPVPTLAATAAPPQPVEYEAQVIRADGMSDEVEYPLVTRIQSPGELTEYIYQYGEIYQFETAFGDTQSFMDAVTPYDDPFFNDHELIIITLEETSGSTALEVSSVVATEDKATVTIVRDEAETGTTDMAQWQVIISVESGVVPSSIQVVTQAG